MSEYNHYFASVFYFAVLWSPVTLQLSTVYNPGNLINRGRVCSTMARKLPCIEALGGFLDTIDFFSIISGV